MLRELQASFAAALLADDERPPSAMIAAADDEAAARFDVYRNNFFASLSGVLASTFPAVGRLIGEHNFRIVARAFIKKFPPRRPQLSGYGGEFPGFLAEFPPLGEYLFLPDLARLEWTRQLSYYADDAPALVPEDLAGVPPEKFPGLKLTLHPAAFLIRSPYAVQTLILADELEEGIAAGAQNVLVTRPGLEVLQNEIAAGEAAFLEAVSAGANIADAAEAALETSESFDLQRALIGHFQFGTFAANFET